MLHRFQSSLSSPFIYYRLTPNPCVRSLANHLRCSFHIFSTSSSSSLHLFDFKLRIIMNANVDKIYCLDRFAGRFYCCLSFTINSTSLVVHIEKAVVIVRSLLRWRCWLRSEFFFPSIYITFDDVVVVACALEIIIQISKTFWTDDNFRARAKHSPMIYAIALPICRHRHSNHTMPCVYF